MCENIESIVESISLVPSENGKTKHHCFVQVGSPEHRNGQQFGAPCCKCLDDSGVADLLRGPDGRLAQTQNRLLGLVRNWSPSNPNLALISALGGDLNSPDTPSLMACMR